MALLLAGGAACGTNPDSAPADGGGEQRTRIAFLNQGAADDEVWTAAHARAASNARDHFAGSAEIDFIQNVDPVAEAPSLIDQLAEEGVDMVVATSFPFSEATRAAAGRHPDIAFEQARGVDVSANIGVFGGADEEPIYLAGIAAGATSTSGVIGYVGTVKEPETIRHVNALALGARSVNPSAEVLVSWVGTWWDPEAELTSATALLDHGADVLATGFVSGFTGEVSRSAGVPWIGHDAEWLPQFPDVWLTGAVPDWTGFYIETIQSVLDGNWEADNYYGSMADSFTDIAAMGDRVPPATRDRIDAERLEFIEGRRDVFSGPIHDRDGTEQVPAGEQLEVDALLEMSFLVEGVEELNT